MSGCRSGRAFAARPALRLQKKKYTILPFGLAALTMLGGCNFRLVEGDFIRSQSLSPVSSVLNDLERSVLEMLLAGRHPILAALREQLAFARISKREVGGAGFHCEFRLDPLAPRAGGDFDLGDVQGEITGVSHGVGFVLFVRNGFIQMLEGYTYEEPWPPTVRQFSLRYADPERKAELRKLDRLLS